MRLTALARRASRGGRGSLRRQVPPVSGNSIRRKGWMTQVRVPEAALGVGLVAAGVLGSMLWSQRGDSQRVLVAARTIQRGESLGADAVRWARTGGDRLAAVGSTAALLGSLAAVRIGAGEPITASMLTSAPPAVPGGVTVAVALDAGDAPADLVPGDTVAVVLVTEVEPGAAPDVARLAVPAVVVGVSEADPMTGARRVVDLGVDAADLAALAGADDVRLARMAVDGTRP